MIHAILKKRVSVLFAVFFACIFSIGLKEFNEFVANFSENHFWFIWGVPIVVFFAAIITKRKTEKHYIQYGIFLAFDFWLVPLMLILLLDCFWKKIGLNFIEPDYIVGYIAFSWLVALADSTRNLSITSIMIASFVLSPLVVLGLLLYNNKHAEDEAEKYIQRAQSAVADGAYNEAINQATEAIEVCSKDKKAEYQLAKCYYWRGKANSLAEKYDEALEDLLKASRLGTGDSFLASIHSEIRDTNLAKEGKPRNHGIPIEDEDRV